MNGSETTASAPAKPRLVEAAIYRRELGVGLARVWENVVDWEHLPALHRDSFASVELLALTPNGYRFALTPQPGAPSRRQVLRLETDKPAGRYVVTTEEGPGAGAEIRTRLTPLSPERTGVEVRFMAPAAKAERVRRTGEQLQAIYRRLWDEDEAMMRRRADMLARRDLEPTDPGPVDLGEVEAVRAQAPFTVEVGGRLVRVDLLDGELLAFSAVCPHWLGPLDETPIEGGIVRCPWHDYLFDVRTGCSADGRGLALEPCPVLAVDHGRAWLRPRTD